MSNKLRPRQCVLEKGVNGYGFHLHGEKGKAGQFIRMVEPQSPAETSGLRSGDKLVFVGGENVESESHQQVVSRIRDISGKLELIVVDQETEELLKKYNLKCLKEYATDGIPIPRKDSADGDVGENGTKRESTPVSEENGEVIVEKKLSINSDKDDQRELRPRLCKIKKGATGYGFNLHSEKSKPGQYIRVVDEDSPAAKSGLRPQDKIVQVNGVAMEGKQHADVVAAIKAGGDETTLLVVDQESDAYFGRCKVLPTEEHVTGPLPEPAINGELEETVNGKTSKEQVAVAVIPSPSGTPSPASVAAVPAASIPPPEQTRREKEAPEDPSLSLTLSLQQAKERAHQKRSSKRAPPMDWSKRNELFSNL